MMHFRFVRKRTRILVYLLLIIQPSLGQGVYEYAKPVDLKDGWKTNSLTTLGMDTMRIHQLFTQLENGQHQLHSTLLIKDNEIILEEYFGHFGVETTHDLRSVTKSIRSLLIGIAVDQGFIESIDDPIIKYLKTPKTEKNPDVRKNRITIQHLLTMSAGWDCNDWDKRSLGQEDRVYKKKDWLQYTLDLPMINEPGEVSNYCSMGTVLLAEVISQAAGMSIDQFAKKYLFDSLGITNLDWGHTSNKEVIASAKRLYLSPREMAKLGQLVLNEGKWNGQQVVSADWIEESTMIRTKITGVDYGYLWWRIPFQVGQRRVWATTATGNGGQYIFVFPELDAVAVFTGGAYNSPKDKLPFAIVKDVLLPLLSTK